MGAPAGHLGGIAEILKNGLPYKAHIAWHARALTECGIIIADIFPKDTADGGTEAKATGLWELNR